MDPGAATSASQWAGSGSVPGGLNDVGRVATRRAGDTGDVRVNGDRRGPKSEVRGPRTGQLDGNDVSRDPFSPTKCSSERRRSPACSTTVKSRAVSSST